MPHILPGGDEFLRRIQLAELDFVTGAEAGARALTVNYVGLPFG